MATRLGTLLHPTQEHLLQQFSFWLLGSSSFDYFVNKNQSKENLLFPLSLYGKSPLDPDHPILHVLQAVHLLQGLGTWFIWPGSVLMVGDGLSEDCRCRAVLNEKADPSSAQVCFGHSWLISIVSAANPQFNSDLGLNIPCTCMD